MPKWAPTVDDESLHTLAGITGFGWTASFLGFLSSVAGYGTGFVSRLFAGPQSLLYIGVALFVTTLGLDRLANTLRENSSRLSEESARD